jgi:hypothetical protein
LIFTFFSFDLVTTYLGILPSFLLSMNESSNQQANEQPPAWAVQLMQRLSVMESTLASNPLFQADPNVTIHAPGSNFIPSEYMLEQYLYIQEDFFKRPLPEADRRRFLFECPKNSLRNYDPRSLIKFACLRLLNSMIRNFTAFSIVCPASLALWIGIPTNFCTATGSFPLSTTISGYGPRYPRTFIRSCFPYYYSAYR